MAFAEAGFDVTGVDLTDERVCAVNEGRSYLVDVPEERYHNLDGERWMRRSTTRRSRSSTR